jgi:ATP synthase protein I
MSNGPDKNSLDQLSQRIAAAKKATEKPPKGQHHEAEVQSAWRMVIELVTGMVVGFGIGYGLDYFFNTLPLFLVTFTLLGFAAGIRIMMQTAKELQRVNIKKYSADVASEEKE